MVMLIKRIRKNSNKIKTEERIRSKNLLNKNDSQNFQLNEKTETGKDPLDLVLCLLEPDSFRIVNSEEIFDHIVLKYFF